MVGNAITPSYRSKRVFSYGHDGEEPYERYFYQGYMKYFKVTGQHLVNKNNEILNPTLYHYFEGESARYSNTYSTIIQAGDTKTEYIYSTKESLDKKDVLERIVTTIEGDNSFKEINSFTYDTERKKTGSRMSRNGHIKYSETYTYVKKVTSLWLWIKTVSPAGKPMTLCSVFL